MIVFFLFSNYFTSIYIATPNSISTAKKSIPQFSAGAFLWNVIFVFFCYFMLTVFFIDFALNSLLYTCKIIRWTHRDDNNKITNLTRNKLFHTTTKTKIINKRTLARANFGPRRNYIFYVHALAKHMKNTSNNKTEKQIKKCTYKTN